MLVRTRSLIAVVILSLIAGCGSPTMCTDCMGGVGSPEIVCPADVTLNGAPGTGQAVTYAGPTTTQGTPPVTTTCVPASGSVFPVGTTTVECTAHDAINRSAVCSFHVTLSSSHLGAMHFLAFGDSTTAGENGDDPPPAGSGFSETFTPAPCGTTSLTSGARTLQAHPQFFDPSISYPQQLLNLLKAQFSGESFVMENEGSPGEALGSGTPTGMQRLVTCFMTDRPDVMLLLEGINDIASVNPGKPYAPTQAQEGQIFGYLKADVSNAISAGVSFVFVSTILPVAVCPVDSDQDCRVGDYGDPTGQVPIANASIDQVNGSIRAGIGGATIVDGNLAFRTADSTLATLIGKDGLHPTQAGYYVLAQAWMNAIVNHIPVTSLRRVR